MSGTRTDLLAILRDAHDLLDGALGDTDLDYFETEEEEREAVPVQVAASLVMKVIQALSERPAPPPGTVWQDFPILRFGFGQIEVGDATHEGKPALFFGRNGQGLGVERERNNLAQDGETLALFTFENLQGLESIEKAVARVRQMLEAQ